VEEAFAGSVCVPGVQEGGDDCEDVRWCCEKEGVDVVVVQGLYDGWKEISDGSGGDDSKEHEHQNISFDIRECKLSTLKETLLLRINPIILSNIFFQTPNGKLSFLFSQPSSGSWEVG